MKTVDNMPDIDLLVTPEQIQAAVRALGPAIQAAYRGIAQVTALVLLEGARWFARDLLLALDDPRFVEVPLKVGSYHGNTQSSGRVNITDKNTCDFRDRHVLIVDDIYDTGRTLHTLIDYLTRTSAASIRTCVMFAKDRCHERPVDIDFLGLNLPDRFVVGYGLDYQGRYRDLPYVGVIGELE
jgi:hypoxanthine phosphoribosyltransferase